MTISTISSVILQIQRQGKLSNAYQMMIAWIRKHRSPEASGVLVDKSVRFRI
jgi:hypothetical protein